MTRCSMDELIRACTEGDVVVVSNVVSGPGGIDIHTVNHPRYRQDEAFIVAVKNGHVAIAELLLNEDRAWRFWPADALARHRQLAAASQLAAARDAELSF